MHVYCLWCFVLVPQVAGYTPGLLVGCDFQMHHTVLYLVVLFLDDN